MRRVALLVAAVALGTAGCGGDHERTLVAYGHSFLTGVPGGAAPWIGAAATELGLPLDNHARSGTTSPEILQSMRDHPPADGDVVVIEAEINDVLLFGESGVDAYRTNLDAMLDLAAGDQVVVIGDPPVRDFTNPGFGLTAGSPEALAAFSEASAEEAASHDATFVDLADGWDVTTMTAPDGVHPTDAGAAFIADRVAAAVQG